MLMARINQSESSFPGGNDLFGVGSPSKRFRFPSIVLCDEPQDRRLAFRNGVKDGVLQAPGRELGKEALDSV